MEYDENKGLVTITAEEYEKLLEKAEKLDSYLEKGIGSGQDSLSKEP